MVHAAIRCRVCGESPSADARFCRRCGARVACPPVDAPDPDPDAAVPQAPEADKPQRL